MSAKKKILIHVPIPFVVKNVLKTDAFSALVSRDDVDIVLLAPHFRCEYYKKEFNSKNLAVESVPKEVLLNKLDYIYQFFTQNSLPTNTVRIKHYRYLYFGAGFLLIRFPLFLVRRLLWYLGKLSFWKKVIGYTYYAFAPRSFKELFGKHRVDVLYTPTLLNSTDMRLLLEARRRGIKTAGSIFSWDNLTAKLLLPFLPEVMAVPNEIIKDELVTYDGARDEQVHVIGYPQYDRYFRKENVTSRESFMESVGLDPKRSYILYAMAGPGNMTTDYAVLSILKDAIETGTLGDVQVLIRPYPKYADADYVEKNFAKHQSFVFDEKVIHMVDDSYWEFSDESISHLTNSIYHSVVVTSTGSTILVEGAVLGKPTVNIAFDGTDDQVMGKEYYNSPLRYLDYDHFRKIINMNAFVSATSGSEYVELFKRYLQNPDADLDKRKKIIDSQCRYTDGQSGKRLAKMLIEALGVQP